MSFITSQNSLSLHAVGHGRFRPDRMDEEAVFEHRCVESTMEPGTCGFSSPDSSLRPCCSPKGRQGLILAALTPKAATQAAALTIAIAVHLKWYGHEMVETGCGVILEAGHASASPALTYGIISSS